MLDLSVLVAASREDQPTHKFLLRWLQRRLASGLPMTVPQRTIEEFVLLITDPARFQPPTSVEFAVWFADEVWRRAPPVACARPEAVWRVAVELIESEGLDPSRAFRAAAAIASGCRLVTIDLWLRRVRDLDWIHPISGRPRCRAEVGTLEWVERARRKPVT